MSNIFYTISKCIADALISIYQAAYTPRFNWLILRHLIQVTVKVLVKLKLNLGSIVITVINIYQVCSAYVKDEIGTTKLINCAIGTIHILVSSPVINPQEYMYQTENLKNKT